MGQSKELSVLATLYKENEPPVRTRQEAGFTQNVSRNSKGDQMNPHLIRSKDFIPIRKKSDLHNFYQFLRR